MLEALPPDPSSSSSSWFSAQTSQIACNTNKWQLSQASKVSIWISENIKQVTVYFSFVQLKMKSTTIVSNFKFNSLLLCILSLHYWWQVIEVREIIWVIQFIVCIYMVKSWYSYNMHRPHQMLNLTNNDTEFDQC